MAWYLLMGLLQSDEIAAFRLLDRDKLGFVKLQRAAARQRQLHLVDGLLCLRRVTFGRTKVTKIRLRRSPLRIPLSPKCSSFVYIRHKQHRKGESFAPLPLLRCEKKIYAFVLECLMGLLRLFRFLRRTDVLSRTDVCFTLS